MSSIDPPSPPDTVRLGLAVAARPTWHTWDGETVVHHALSNDSHRLADPAGRLLARLAEDGPLTPEALAAVCGLRLEDCAASLDALLDLDLVDWR